MPRFVALLRAVNVGGTGKLPMSELRRICTDLGFRNVSTYLASGNAIFDADGSAAAVSDALDTALGRRMGKAPGVILRSPAEMADLIADLPFSGAEGARVGVLFLPGGATDAEVATLRGGETEAVALHRGHIVIHFPSGMGRSRLRGPAFDRGTLRNRNTVAALWERALA